MSVPELWSERLRLTPFALEDFERFVTGMLVDPRVVQHYHSYDHEADIATIRKQAIHDFWDHFEESRAAGGLEIWAAYPPDDAANLIGWAGLLRTTISEQYNAPELQYMIAGNAHGSGYATEMAAKVLTHAKQVLGVSDVIGIVDMPNLGSIRVLEKLGFGRVGQIEAYGSAEMLLYRRDL